MLTIPNLLSLLRLPLAFLFLEQNVICRATVIVCAMLTDILDGFLARKYRQSTRLGTLLDPITDRFFVFFLIGIFFKESQLSFWQASTLLCRDLSVILFGFYLVLTDKLTTYRFRAIWCGKITTSLQFIVFLGITLGYYVPPFVFFFFVLLGLMALVELYMNKEDPQMSTL